MVQLHNRARNWRASDKLTCQFQAGRSGSPAPVPHGSTLPHDSDYSMTLRYAHLAPEFKLKAVEVLGHRKSQWVGTSFSRWFGKVPMHKV